MPRSLATARREVHIDAVVLGLIAVWIVGFGAAAGWLARRRHRAVAIWVAIGAITGPIALLLLERAPLGRCPNCDATVHGWATVCVWCGGDVRHAGGVAAGVVAPGPATYPTSRPAVIPAATGPRTTDVTRPRGARPTGTILERATASRPAALATPATALATPITAPATPATTSADTGSDTPDAPVPAPPPPKPRARRTTSKGRGTAGAGTTPARAKTPAKRSTSARNAAAPAVLATAPAASHTLASAVFVTGSVGFQPGSWYTLETDGVDFRVLGPLDRDARAVALSRPVGPLDASAVNGRLVVNGDDGLVMVFMRMAGMSAEEVAELIERTGVSDGGAHR